MQGNRAGLMYKVAAWSVAIITPAFASAALTIGVSATTIHAAAGQTVNIVSTASGSDATAGIKGLDLGLQIDNGGSANGASNPTAPTFTLVDLTTGIFSGNNTGNQYAGIQDPFVYFDSINTNSGVVQVGTNGVLGTITFNAAGLSPGTFDLYFSNVGPNDPDLDGYDSDYDNSSGVGQSYTNGYAYPGSPIVFTIVGVPEPCVGLMGAGLATTALLRRRRRSVNC